jgi:spore coat polysaccharide biosynthesis protein SpsF
MKEEPDGKDLRLFVFLCYNVNTISTHHLLSDMYMQKTVAIIQARMGSTRLPGKILKPILGWPMLAQMLERVKQAKKIDAIVVATTDKTEDDAIAQLAQECSVNCFRGDENDVLDRFYKAAKEAGASIVVRLTGDCPLHDPAVIDEVIGRFLNNKLDYACTPVNYPEGLDTEVFLFSALERAWKSATLPSEREHVTRYIRNHPELFNVGELWKQGDYDYSVMHWSVDTEQDFDFVTKVFEQLYPVNPRFNKDDVFELLARRPELLEINKGGTGYEGLAKSLKEDMVVKSHL